MKDRYPKANTKCGPMTLNISQIIQHQDDYDHNRKTIWACPPEDWAADHRNNFYNILTKKKTIKAHDHPAYWA